MKKLFLIIMLSAAISDWCVTFDAAIPFSNAANAAYFWDGVHMTAAATTETAVGSSGCRDYYGEPFWFSHGLYEPWKRFLFGIALALVGLGVSAYGSRHWGTRVQSSWLDRIYIGLGCGLFIVSGGVVVFGHLWPPRTICDDYQQSQQTQEHRVCTQPFELRSG